MDKAFILDRYSIRIKSPYNLDELIQKMPDVFSETKIQPLNNNPKYDSYVGDMAIELNTKYKNFYKKVFNPKQIVSPFIASQIIQNPQDPIWVYLDDQDNIQGPFSSIVMDNWYNQGLLPMD